MGGGVCDLYPVCYCTTKIPICRVFTKTKNQKLSFSTNLVYKYNFIIFNVLQYIFYSFYHLIYIYQL